VLLTGAVGRSQVAVPTITLTPGEMYFRVDGVPSFVLGTNPVGWNQGTQSNPNLSQFDTLFGYASVNDKIVRIHLTNGLRPHPTAAGQVDEAWASMWDDVFDSAEAYGLLVLPVFDVHADWREDLTGTQSWTNNIYNVANPVCDPLNAAYDPAYTCGPAVHPEELLIPGAARDLWLGWLETLVNRWKGRSNILGWEIFSELDLITDTRQLNLRATEADGVVFVEAAAARIRAADTSGRPVTASLSGIIDWPSLSTSSIDFYQIHPYANIYPYTGDLDQMILDTVRARRALYAPYGKPIFIGESGLDARAPITYNTLELDPEAPVGINQAIWASAVSGAMTGRMLWFEDGYDQFHLYPDGTMLDLRTSYANASAAVARFVTGVDYTGFEPVNLTVGADLMGATLGDADLVLGWVRDALSVAPDWPARLLSGQTVTVDVPGQSDDWIVNVYNTSTGDLISSVDADQDGNGDITVTLPDFEGSIAFQILAVPPLDVLIDVRPDSSLNRINPNRGRVFVAVLTTTVAAGDPLDFDAATVDPSTVRFGPAGAAPLNSGPADADGDGDLDLLLRFRNREMGFVCGDTVGTLTGETATGRSIVGSDSVTIVGCP